MIGIGITTTLGRKETAKHCIDQIIKLAPERSKIVVVQDVPGIAKAKNNCLAQLDGCTDVFLFDDDVFPIKQYWFDPYIKSGIKQLNFTFSNLADGRQNGNRELLKKEKGLCYYANPCGLMMYIHRDCLDAIGGFDEGYEGYAYEHVQYAVRAYNAGLIPEKFIDVENSLSLFYSYDYHMKGKSSVKPEDRMKYIKINREKFNQDQGSKAWMPYK